MKSETASGIRALLTVFAIWAALVAYTVWSWHHVAKTGEFYPVAALGLPFCEIGMVGLVIVGGSFSGKFADMPAARASKAKLAFAAVLILAFAAGSVNFFYMENKSAQWRPPEIQAQP